jgi:protein PhnA
MSTFPPCPLCQSDNVYQDQVTYICPECAHEWSVVATDDADEMAAVLDAYGTPLADGDSITVVKDLKVKGASSSLKVGTKVKNIRLVEGDHNIDCKIPGFGDMKLKSEFVKKLIA